MEGRSQTRSPNIRCSAAPAESHLYTLLTAESCSETWTGSRNICSNKPPKTIYNHVDLLREAHLLSSRAAESPAPTPSPRGAQQGQSSLQAAPQLRLKKEARFHSSSLCPGLAQSAQSKPNYRAAGRAVPTSSEQKAVASTRRKCLC